MLENWKAGWKGLNVKILVNKRELVLGMASCAMAGMLLGMFCSPKKQVTIGSNNGSNNSDNGNGNSSSPWEKKLPGKHPGHCGPVCKNGAPKV